MKISKEEILHIAELADLKINDNEIDKYILNLQDILNFANIVNNAPVEGLDVTVGTSEAKNVFRKDEVRKFEDSSECKVTIPDFGESYELGADGPELLEETEEIEAYRKEFRRLDIIDRIEELKESIADIESVVMKKNLETNDNDLMNLEDRVKEIQKQIQELMK